MGRLAARLVATCLATGSALAPTACGGGGRAGAPRPSAAPGPTAIDTDVSRDALAHELEATVLEIYSHLTLGNFAAFRDTLAGEEPVALFGVTPGDTVVGMQPREAGYDRRLYRASSPTVLAKNLEIHVSADASVGWTFDELSYRVPFGGRVASIPVRSTSLFIRDFDRWVLVLEHQSYPTAIDDLRATAAAGHALLPRRFASRPLVGPARELVRLVGLLHDADAHGGVRIAAGDETLVLLPDRDHELHGAEAAEAPSLAALFGPGTTVALRDYRLGIAKNQSIAWLAANLVVHTLVNDERVEIGMRGTYVFRRAARGWELVQMHVSAPVGERELSRRVFGSP
ncbi:MAG TPA: nuclear transport factor 2 family protein [Kofleriaceae bacterium]|nr:nuclear transport factor 2 family protein [Kofleriaceae bacterium]